MKRPQFPFIVILTSIVLLLTLLGFFVHEDSLLAIQWVLVRWAVIIAAFAVILGFLNVISVHIAKLAGRTSGWPYSLAIGLGELIFRQDEGLWGPLMAPIFVWVIAPLQAATAALLPFILTYAAYRMLRWDRQRGSLIFLISALIVLIGRLPLPDLGTGLQDLHDAWLSWLAIPGLRAVLIGVALGISMTALRLLMGIDRPQG
jgi:hypothetical protein